MKKKDAFRCLRFEEDDSFLSFLSFWQLLVDLGLDMADASTRAVATANATAPVAVVLVGSRCCSGAWRHHGC